MKRLGNETSVKVVSFLTHWQKINLRTQSPSSARPPFRGVAAELVKISIRLKPSLTHSLTHSLTPSPIYRKREHDAPPHQGSGPKNRNAFQSFSHDPSNESTRLHNERDASCDFNTNETQNYQKNKWS